MTQLEITIKIKSFFDYATGISFTLLMLCIITFLWIKEPVLWNIVITLFILMVMFAVFGFTTQDRIYELKKKGNP